MALMKGHTGVVEKTSVMGVREGVRKCRQMSSIGSEAPQPTGAGGPKEAI